MRIAEDKVAETIKGYVYAIDDAGVEVRRPARRGVAYRMLKECSGMAMYFWRCGMDMPRRWRHWRCRRCAWTSRWRVLA